MSELAFATNLPKVNFILSSPRDLFMPISLFKAAVNFVKRVESQRLVSRELVTFPFDRVLLQSGNSDVFGIFSFDVIDPELNTYDLVGRGFFNTLEEAQAEFQATAVATAAATGEPKKGGKIK